MGHSLCKFERSLHAGLEEKTFTLRQLWFEESGQDVAEYSVMLAVVLVIVVGTIRLIGSNAGNIFSQVGSTIQ
jgi:Flp pilus assembly pilin Flp